MRDHNVAGLTGAELDRARRELAASLALARPGSPIRAPILARMSAIDTELTGRGIRMCGCGLATDNAAMMDGHLSQYPDHQERDLSRYQIAGRLDPRKEGPEPMIAIGTGTGIGTGRNDPRRWVKAAYHLIDAMERGETGPQHQLPTSSQVTAKLGISARTVERAYRELTDMGIIYRVAGHGYFPSVSR